MSHKFGWCLDGHHKTCPHEIFSLKSQDGRVVATEHISTCGCQCHEE